MVLKEDIILPEGGSGSGATKKPEKPIDKETESLIKVAARKLMHKTQESVNKGLQSLKDYAYRYGQDVFNHAKREIYNYVVNHPLVTTGYIASAISALKALRSGRLPSGVASWVSFYRNFTPVLAADLRRTPAHVFPDKNKRLEKYPHGYDRLRPGLNRLSLFNTLPVLASGIKGAAAMNFARYREPQPKLPQLSPNSQHHYYNFFHTYANDRPAYLVNPALID